MIEMDIECFVSKIMISLANFIFNSKFIIIILTDDFIYDIGDK